MISILKQLQTAAIILKGGPGSGNFGHAGIPGQVGGSDSLSVGDKWMSPLGEKEIIRHEGDKYFVSTAGSNNLQIVNENELSQDKKRDGANLQSRNAADAKNRAEVELENIRQDTKGFYDTLSPATAGKAKAVLNQNRVFNGKLTRIKDFVEETVISGGYVNTSSGGERRLNTSHGTFYSEKQLPKLSIDYAEFLQGKR